MPLLKRRDLPATHAHLTRCAKCLDELDADRSVFAFDFRTEPPVVPYLLCEVCFSKYAGLIRRLFEQPTGLTRSESIALEAEIQDFAAGVRGGIFLELTDSGGSA
jgi:hypothetical protein